MWTVVLVATFLPGAGSWATIVCGGLDDGTSIADARSPRPASVSIASVSDLPRTSGTTVSGAPAETWRFTSLPFGTLSPACGSCEITIATGTVALGTRL